MFSPVRLFRISRSLIRTSNGDGEKIDVYKGLLDILGIPTSTENVFEEAPQEAVSIYASGTKGSFHVRWAEVPSSFSIHVYDASGRHLYEKKSVYLRRWITLFPWEMSSPAFISYG